MDAFVLGKNYGWAISIIFAELERETKNRDEKTHGFFTEKNAIIDVFFRSRIPQRIFNRLA